MCRMMRVVPTYRDAVEVNINAAQSREIKMAEAVDIAEPLGIAI